MQTTVYQQSRVPARHLIRDLPESERPFQRACRVGVRAVSTVELLALLLGTPDGIDMAQEVLTAVGSLRGLASANRAQLTHIPGVGDGLVLRLQAAIELGRRYIHAEATDRERITSPADAANLVMSEMMYLDQEHFRIVILDTRNKVLGTPTIYIGSLNTSAVRIGEIFQVALEHRAAAIILIHNHPSGDPSPSPEDVSVTRQIVQAGSLLNVDVLDHLVIGHQRFVSLKERGLGFS